MYADAHIRILLYRIRARVVGRKRQVPDAVFICVSHCYAGHIFFERNTFVLSFFFSVERGNAAVRYAAVFISSPLELIFVVMAVTDGDVASCVYRGKSW